MKHPFEASSEYTELEQAIADSIWMQIHKFRESYGTRYPFPTLYEIYLTDGDRNIDFLCFDQDLEDFIRDLYEGEVKVAYKTVWKYIQEKLKSDFQENQKQKRIRSMQIPRFEHKTRYQKFPPKKNRFFR